MTLISPFEEARKLESAVGLEGKCIFHSTTVPNPATTCTHANTFHSGKSSLLLSILRMIELTSGKIMLDGYDTSTLPRPLIRQKLICLTQQPFLFTGSVRLNADPLTETSDSQIADVLKKVELWGVILRKIGTDGSDIASVLDTNLDENFLSHGQRQLFCLARAMLKKGLILLLDEPTSRYVPSFMPE